MFNTDMSNVMSGMFGRLANGQCRLAMDGSIAVKTPSGYKTYDVDSGRLTNCSNFVFDVGSELFFVIPTNRPKKGDILLISGMPKCVIEVKPNALTVMNYADSTIETVCPERHIFMGNTYFYGVIVSMFGRSFKKGKGNGVNKIFKYMMMSEMMKGCSGGSSSFGNLLPLMMLSGKGSDMFDDMLDCDWDEDEDEDTDIDSEEEKESK